MTENANFDKNVFQIWLDNDKQLPFKVRRWTWHPETYFLVKEVKVKWAYYEKTGNIYGTAKGDMYLRGKLADPNITLGCSGCYQWTRVKEENNQE